MSFSLIGLDFNALVNRIDNTIVIIIYNMSYLDSFLYQPTHNILVLTNTSVAKNVLQANYLTNFQTTFLLSNFIVCDIKLNLRCKDCNFRCYFGKKIFCLKKYAQVISVSTIISFFI